MKQENNNGPIYAGAAIVCVLIVVLGVIFSGVLKTGTGSTTIPQGNLNTVSVSASGSAIAAPSMATIDLSINATGNSTRSATANFSSRLAAFNQTVYGYIGGNTSLVKTQYYNVAKAYSNNSAAAPVYQAQESLAVTLPQIGSLNGFLVNITAVPGLQVEDVDAVLSDSQVTQLRQQALQGAIANATSQARAIIGNATIASSNVSVESYNFYPYPIYALGSGAAALAPKTSPLYYNGTSSVVENIQVVFYYRK